MAHYWNKKKVQPNDWPNYLMTDIHEIQINVHVVKKGIMGLQIKLI